MIIIYINNYKLHIYNNIQVQLLVQARQNGRI